MCVFFTCPDGKALRPVLLLCVNTRYLRNRRTRNNEPIFNPFQEGLTYAGLALAPRLAPAEVISADTPSAQSLLTLAIAVVVVGCLYLASAVMIPIILTVLLSFLLAPWLTCYGACTCGVCRLCCSP